MNPRVKKTTLPGGVCPTESLADLEGFYRAFFLPLARRAVRKYGLSMEDGADVVQDAFILAVERLDASKNPKAWLYQVVDHLALNLVRKRRRRAALSARWAPYEGPEGRGPDAD